MITTYTTDQWRYDLIDREVPGRWDIRDELVSFARPVDQDHVRSYLSGRTPDWATLEWVRPVLPVGTRVYYEDLDGGEGTITDNVPTDEGEYVVDFDDLGPIRVSWTGILRVLETH